MATIHEASTEELPRHLEGVNGWLLFFCVTTTIFAPILYITAAFQSASPVEGVIELLFGVFAAVSGGFVWSVQAQALRLLRIYLVLVLCLAGLGILGSLSLLQRTGAGANGIHIVGLLNSLRFLLINILWWKYFRRSRRVKATFGENMGSLRDLF